MAKITNKNILVVDDSMTNLVLLEALLTDIGYEVRTACSPDIANRIMKRWWPDLILIDLLMPGENDGFSFFRQLKQNEKQKNIPVAIVSALEDKKAIERAISLGAMDYMLKPVDANLLVEKVNTIFSFHYKATETRLI